MNDLFTEAAAVMEDCFTILEEKVPPPQQVRLKAGYWYRYIERMPQQAIVQKLGEVCERPSGGSHTPRARLRTGTGCASADAG